MTTPAEVVLGFAISTANTAECVDQVLEWIKGRSGPRSVVCANPHSLYLATVDPEFGDAMRQADMIIADGIGVLLASRLRGGRIRTRVTGSDLFHGVNSAIAGTDTNRVFLLGSTRKVLNRLTEEVTERYPGLRVVGVLSPPFRDGFVPAEINEMVARVNEAEPDVVWIGMTAPKQEKWIRVARQRLEAPVVCAVGAVFDYVAGSVRRPRPLIRALGLEWLSRLLGEHRRLWRRTFQSGPLFFAAVLAERIRGGGGDT